MRRNYSNTRWVPTSSHLAKLVLGFDKIRKRLCSLENREGKTHHACKEGDSAAVKEGALWQQLKAAPRGVPPLQFARACLQAALQFKARRYGNP